MNDAALDQVMKDLNLQGFFTLSDISNALAMNKDEKTMCRVLHEIRKVHKNIGEKANRYGRKFQYTYHLTGRSGKSVMHSGVKSSERQSIIGNPGCDIRFGESEKIMESINNEEKPVKLGQ